MELLFTWIENYRNIQKQGINFSAEFDIAFDCNTNVLSIKESPNFIPSFFGKSISNISVIVGENGTGKTSILNIEESIFHLIKQEEEIIVIASNEDFLSEITIKSSLKTKKIKENKFYDTLFIHYSNSVDSLKKSSYNTSFRSDTFFDLTTNNLVKGLINYQQENLHSELLSFSSEKPIVKQIRMYLSEIEKQMNFLLRDNNNRTLNFKTPEDLSVSFNVDSEIEFLHDIFQNGGRFSYGDSHKDVKEITSCFLKHLSKLFSKNKYNSWDSELLISKKEYALFLLRWSMFLSFINSFSAPNSSAGNGPDQWLGFDSDWENKPIEQWFNNFFSNFITLDDNYHGSKFEIQIEAWASFAVRFVEKFEELLNSNCVTFNLDERSHLISLNNKHFGKNMTLTVNFSNDEHKKSIYEILVKAYNDIQNPLNFRNDNKAFLSFDWRGVSTGELAMLRVFSRFNRIREVVKYRREVQSPIFSKGQIKTLIFLIDEGEIGLHPTWQQQFLNKLIENLPPMFEDVGVESIQLILTTHSPFILSDVPNNHVIFLEKGKKGNCVVIKNPLHDKKMTFGANIHSLLSDGFFMKEGLMGDFAKKKINKLIDDLIEKGNQLSSERKVEIQKMIPLIGEPIIRKKVLDLYNEQINLNIDDRIRLLEESKNQLEKDIQMLKERAK